MAAEEKSTQTRKGRDAAGMIAFGFSFPGGRYHATPWGRHANEADVAWPPEPARILRAFIATWWRKGDHGAFPKAQLDDLIDCLAGTPPVYLLPRAVQSHSRSYMPAPADKKLVYDGFLRLDAGAEMIIAWPSGELSLQQRSICAHLLDRIGYFGRAESWVLGRLADDWTGEFNASPLGESLSSTESTPADLVAALTPDGWTVRRAELLTALQSKPLAARKLIERTLPERLSDALSVDTGDWQQAGWSNPPPLRTIVYDRPVTGPLPIRVPPRHRSQRETGPLAARFVLAGRPLPTIGDTIKVGELMRAALMSGNGISPPEFSGRNSEGAKQDDPAHAHAFFLPEDADSDGLIDHIVVYCRNGFSHEGRRRLHQLSRLWLAYGHTSEEGERGRKEWRLALEDIAASDQFHSALLRKSACWTSGTPYLMPWHKKREFGPLEQIRREIRERGTFPPLVSAEIIDSKLLRRRPVQFRRTRSRRGLIQPDTLGCFMKMTFAEPVKGPVALGFGCHFGLGLFTATGALPILTSG